MLVLASAPMRRQLQMPCLARIRSVACVRETRSADAGPGLMGEALCEALRLLGAQDGTRGSISDVYCDLNGERPRTTDWGFALLRLGAWLRDGTDYSTPVGSCGDLGAAAIR